MAGAGRLARLHASGRSGTARQVPLWGNTHTSPPAPWGGTMDLVFYWHAFKHWRWVLLLTIAATIAGIFYFENQRGKPWQSEVEINVMCPYALTPASYDNSPPPPGGITDQFDFTHIAN